MTASRPARPVRPPAERPAAQPERAPEREPEKAPECNLPGCDEAPEYRGLCSSHRQTHRGLLDPVFKEAKPRD